MSARVSFLVLVLFSTLGQAPFDGQLNRPFLTCQTKAKAIPCKDINSGISLWTSVQADTRCHSLTSRTSSHTRVALTFLDPVSVTSTTICGLSLLHNISWTQESDIFNFRKRTAIAAGLQKLHKNQNTRMESSQSDSDDDFSSSYREPKGASCGNLKPMDITFMNRKLEMKFYVKEKKRHEYFSDGLSGKNGAYFPSDGEVVFIEPDDKDVIYLD